MIHSITSRWISLNRTFEIKRLNFLSIYGLGEEAPDEKPTASLRLWPSAVMNPFCLRAQRVNGWWDYAMARQMPFSPPALLYSLFSFGCSQTRHSSTFQPDPVKCSGRSRFRTNVGTKQGFYYTPKLPIAGASYLPGRGKSCRQLQLLRLWLQQHGALPATSRSFLIQHLNQRGVDDVVSFSSS